MALFEDLNKILAEVLDNYGDYVIEQLKSNRKRFGLLDNDVRSSGKLIKSMEKQIVFSSSTGLAQLLLGFEPYGRFSDMKASQINRTKKPPVKELEEMIREKGLEKYKLNKELRKIRRLRGENAAIRDLASRLATAMFQNKNGRRKKRRWRFDKVFYGTITKVRKDIAFAFTKEQLEILNKLSFPEKIEIKL